MQEIPWSQQTKVFLQGFLSNNGQKRRKSVTGKGSHAHFGGVLMFPKTYTTKDQQHKEGAAEKKNSFWFITRFKYNILALLQSHIHVVMTCAI